MANTTNIIYCTIDKLMCATLKEWIEYLDGFNLDDAHTLFYSIFTRNTRDALHRYWKGRMLGYKIN